MKIEDISYYTVRALFGEDAANKYKNGNLPNELLMPIAEEIKRISVLYNSKDDNRNQHKLISSLNAAKAYLAYYNQINFAKLSFFFSEIVDTLVELVSINKRIKILDFGCGAGAGFLASYEIFQKIRNSTEISIELDYTGCDYSEEMLNVAKIFWQASEYKKEVTYKTTSNFESIQKEKIDIIIFANVLNEMGEEKNSLLKKLIDDNLSDKGIVIILEPALQLITIGSMSFRDQLLKSTPLTVLFPCTHNLECPMLKDNQLNQKQNWCHSELFSDWQPSRLIKQLDDLTGFNKHKIKYSGFIFQKRSGQKSEENRNARVVSFPINDKRGLTFWGCSKNGYEKTSLSKKEIKERLRDKGLNYKKLKIYDEYI